MSDNLIFNSRFSNLGQSTQNAVRAAINDTGTIDTKKAKAQLELALEAIKKITDETGTNELGPLLTSQELNALHNILNTDQKPLDTNIDNVISQEEKEAAEQYLKEQQEKLAEFLENPRPDNTPKIKTDIGYRYERWEVPKLEGPLESRVGATESEHSLITSASIEGTGDNKLDIGVKIPLGNPDHRVEIDRLDAHANIGLFAVEANLGEIGPSAPEGIVLHTPALGTDKFGVNLDFHWNPVFGPTASTLTDFFNNPETSGQQIGGGFNFTYKDFVGLRFGIDKSGYTVTGLHGETTKVDGLIYNLGGKWNHSIELSEKSKVILGAGGKIYIFDANGSGQGVSLDEKGNAVDFIMLDSAEQSYLELGTEIKASVTYQNGRLSITGEGGFGYINRVSQLAENNGANDFNQYKWNAGIGAKFAVIDGKTNKLSLYINLGIGGTGGDFYYTKVDMDDDFNFNFTQAQGNWNVNNQRVEVGLKWSFSEFPLFKPFKKFGDWLKKIFRRPTRVR
jgi:hypothetical protein